MIEKLKKLFLGKYLGLGVRHILTLLGGYLVSKGLATPEDAALATEGVSNIVITTIGALSAATGVLASVVGAAKGTK